MIALPCLLYSMDLAVLNLAVPSLTEELKPSSTQVLWIIDIYGFMVAGWLIMRPICVDAGDGGTVRGRLERGVA